MKFMEDTGLVMTASCYRRCIGSHYSEGVKCNDDVEYWTKRVAGWKSNRQKQKIF